MKVRIGSGYRERHSRNTLVVFTLMLVIVIGSAYYIYDYGLNNADGDIEVTEFAVSIGFYATDTNLTGSVRILYMTGTEFQNLTVDSEGVVEGIAMHPIGGYKLYYEGLDNAITFGPIEYNVAAQDTLLIDRDFVGVQVTIRTV
jgi:hypothetical protein